MARLPVKSSTNTQNRAITSNDMKKIIISSIIALALFQTTQAQVNERIDPVLQDYIEKKVMKCATLFAIQSRGKGLKDLLRSNKYWDYESETIKSGMVAFGFCVRPDIITTKYPKEYPDKNYTLYKVEIPKSQMNDSLYRRFNFVVGDYVIAINKIKDIKFVGGDFFKHHIVQDFKFKKRDPNSYLLFLELTYFDMEHSGLKYIGKKGDKYLYEGKSRNPYYLKFTIELDPENPEKSKRVSEYSEDKSTWFHRNETPIKFKTQDEAKNFLLGEVMKNIYIYRLRNTPGIWDFIEPNSNYFKGNAAPIDHLIPDYDEKLLFSYQNHDWWPSDRFIALRIRKTEKDILERPAGYLRFPDKGSEEDTIKMPFRWEKFYAHSTEQHFLAFMNLDDNLIYYMSGDYFLSKVLDMDKHYGSRGQQIYYQPDFPKNYIVDRLFKYQIFKMDDLKFISEDGEKIVYEAESKLSARKKLKITFSKKVPEDLLVEEN